MIREIEDAREKQRIARLVLEELTDWFGNPEARESYIRDSGEQWFFAAFEDGAPAGFLAMKKTGPAAAEVAVMGVLQRYHRRGLGRALFRCAAGKAEALGCAFMQVKTVRMGCYADYDETNRFYQALGFRELEVIPELWGEANPCQIYVMALPRGGEMLRLILGRRSYRGKYRPDPVPREHLTEILQAGLAAPSGCNRQTVSLIAVDDPALLARLHSVIQPPVGETAPAMICVLSRPLIAYRDRCFAVQDYAAAIENMLLAIVSLGYESCWYEGHITDTDRIGAQMAQILGVPEGWELVCFLPVGVAEGKTATPKKKSFAERAGFNAFPGGSGDEAI